MKMKGLLITIGVIVFLAISIIPWAIKLSNSEITTRNLGKAQQEVCAAFFDKMWKVIQQDAQVADKYKDSFKEIYVPLIEGRYSKGDGTLMKWITESNPQFDTKLFDKLMNAIEAQREGFFMEQKKLIDIDMKHKNMRQTFPNSWIIGKRLDLGIVIIKSLTTNEAYKTGQENDINLFKKN